MSFTRVHAAKNPGHKTCRDVPVQAGALLKHWHHLYRAQHHLGRQDTLLQTSCPRPCQTGQLALLKHTASYTPKLCRFLIGIRVAFTQFEC